MKKVLATLLGLFVAWGIVPLLLRPCWEHKCLDELSAQINIQRMILLRVK